MKALTAFLFLALILASGCVHGINGPIVVGDNITRTGGIHTVNGSVSIGGAKNPCARSRQRNQISQLNSIVRPMIIAKA